MDVKVSISFGENHKFEYKTVADLELFDRPTYIPSLASYIGHEIEKFLRETKEMLRAEQESST